MGTVRCLRSDDLLLRTEVEALDKLEAEETELEEGRADRDLRW